MEIGLQFVREYRAGRSTMTELGEAYRNQPQDRLRVGEQT